jgi:ubiquinone/menaquinone biosynthesis C-methylase UbiE
MPSANAAFVGSIPENYDRYLGPVLFEPFAADLAERVSARVPANGKVLELACGTGIVTRRLRDRLPDTVQIVATDLNEAMMNHAARKFALTENVEWRQADATNLPFEDQSFDAIVCQFGVMFFPDKQQAMREAFRVLKPGGSFWFSTWDAIELNDLPMTAHSTVSRYFDDHPPDFYEVPFSFHDENEITQMLSASGFARANVTRVVLASNASSAEDLAKGLVHGNPIIASLRERCESKIPEIEDEVAAGIASKCGDNPVKAKMHAVICEATRT